MFIESPRTSAEVLRRINLCFGVENADRVPVVKKAVIVVGQYLLLFDINNIL